jgi:hypothetical protein
MYGPPFLLREKHVSRATNGKRPGRPVILAENVDLDFSPAAGIGTQTDTSFVHSSPFIVCSGRVRLCMGSSGLAIFALGDVHISGDVHDAIVVCGGDVKWDCRADKSLIIARGYVTLGHFSDESRIISGKTIRSSKAKYRPGDMHVENEINPLGYIRWSTPAKKEAKEAEHKKQQPS